MSSGPRFLKMLMFTCLCLLICGIASGAEGEVEFADKLESETEELDTRLLEKHLVPVTTCGIRKCSCQQSCSIPPSGPVAGGGQTGSVGVVTGGGSGGPKPVVPVSPGSGFDGSGLIDIRIVNKPGAAYGDCPANHVLCCKGQPIPRPTPFDNLQAEFAEYPWMVVILTNEDKYRGGGTMITNSHVLTAAHKIYNSPHDLKARMGEWNAKINDEVFKYIDQPISLVTIHPQFTPANLFNDVALLTLARPVDISNHPHISSACLPHPTDRWENVRCWVSGFGKNDFGTEGKHQAIMKEVDVSIMNSNECESRLRTTRLGANFFLNKESFICAGGEEGKDACEGDGGSPLVCQAPDKKFYVVGLVAWGIDCAQKGIPGVYVNVAQFTEWIISETGPFQ